MVSHVSASVAIACQRIAAGTVKGMVSKSRVPSHIQKVENMNRKRSAIIIRSHGAYERVDSV
jgi:hypothetical protein